MNLLPKRNVPRPVIFMIDIFVCLVALMVAYLVRFDFLSIPYEQELPVLKRALPFYILIRGLTFYFGKTYVGMVRYTSTQDAKRIFLTVTAGSVIFMLLSPIMFHYVDGYYFLPKSIIIVDYLGCVFFLISFRIAVKLMYLESQRDRKEQLDVAIYGAGQSGLITKRTLDREANRKQHVQIFVDDDPKKADKAIEGARIVHTGELDKYLSSGKVDQLIISIQNPDPENKRKVVDTALKYGVEVLNVPPVSTWINGELNAQQIKKVRIEDLLGRKPIRVENTELDKQLKNKVVLVTGAAGSIGAGIVRQIVRYSPKKIILLDQAESPLYEIEQEVIRDGYGEIIEAVVADITNRSRLEEVFNKHSPEVVYHAAAYKHVPLMEMNVSEAVITNVGGTTNLVDLAIENEVETFVMVSTDKAVNPTSVMGASKRVAEIYAQVSQSSGKTRFITTRFGNVLGSSGSVIPLFRKQIEGGGPVTVTHEEVTRYFMTIPEACQLVLEAGSMGEGGEIFIFDMGESVRIMDLAEKMVRLSGLVPGKDIEIKVTGLRPGEKLYEELLANEENTLKTHHPQILRAKVREYKTDILKEVKDIVSCGSGGNIDTAVKRMKELVPEYISNNSEFANFDANKVEQ